MTKRDIWEIASTAIITISVIGMLGMYLYDRRSRVTGSPEQHEPDWQTWAETGIRIGPDNAGMVIAQFVDFRCPYCSGFAPVLDSVLAAFDGEVALEIHHFPLASHELAVPTAVAAECADRQGKFRQMYNTLYEQMDSVGRKTWRELAADAEIGDIPAFEACIQLPAEQFSRIAAGRALGERIGITGTPTIYVNGTLSRERSFVGFQDIAQELGVSPSKSTPLVPSDGAG
ncbi:MAG: thioredoxin domain-containing protein [Gemmatimonadota bacterium]